MLYQEIQPAVYSAEIVFVISGNIFIIHILHKYIVNPDIGKSDFFLHYKQLTLHIIIEQRINISHIDDFIPWFFPLCSIFCIYDIQIHISCRCIILHRLFACQIFFHPFIQLLFCLFILIQIFFFMNSRTICRRSHIINFFESLIECCCCRKSIVQCNSCNLFFAIEKLIYCMEQTNIIDIFQKTKSKMFLNIFG